MPLDMQELKFYHGAVYLAWRIADEMLHMFVNLVTGSSTAVPAVLSLGKYSTWAELMIRYDFQSKYVLMALPGTSHHCRVGIIYKGWFRAEDFTIDPLTLAQVKRVWNYGMSLSSFHGLTTCSQVPTHLYAQSRAAPTL